MEGEGGGLAPGFLAVAFRFVQNSLLLELIDHFKDCCRSGAGQTDQLRARNGTEKEHFIDDFSTQIRFFSHKNSVDMIL